MCACVCVCAFLCAVCVYVSVLVNVSVCCARFCVLCVCVCASVRLCMCARACRGYSMGVMCSCVCHRPQGSWLQGQFELEFINSSTLISAYDISAALLASEFMVGVFA